MSVRVELADSAAPAIDLPVWSKLFERKQVQHSAGFNASLAQSHNMLSHQRHQGVIRVKTKGLARVRKGCGHDSDLLRLEGSSR
jgi:hypothetical protein